MAKALEKSGFVVKHQVGCSGYYIDMALVDPERPGRYILGIECDGATYHRSATARDRDRLRQDILENLGWKIHRIWSTDWIRQPEAQIEKIRHAYDLAKESLENIEELSPVNTKPRNDEEPTIHHREASSASSYQFKDIDRVSDEVIQNLMLDILKTYPSIKEDEFLRCTSKKLGFARMGSKIEGRLTGLLNYCIMQGYIIRNGDHRLSPPSKNE